MLKSGNGLPRSFPLLCGIWLLLLLTSFATAQHRPEDRLDRAKRFLKLTYPELTSKSSKVCVQDENGFGAIDALVHFSLVLWQDVPTCLLMPGSEAQYRGGRPLITAFWYDGEGQVLQFNSLFNEDLIDKARNDIDSHPDWTEAEVIAYLDQNQFKYGPNHKDAFIRQIQAAELSELLGPFTINSIDFELRDAGAEGWAPSALLWWQVEADCVRASKHHECYFAFEPVNGRLRHFQVRR